MEIKAQLNYLKIAPRKVRLAVDLIRGLTVGEATKRLDFLTKRSANPIKKLVLSAAANAKNNFKIANTDDLIIKEASVNQGPVLKRFRPRAFGRAAMIKKRMSHITVILEAKQEAKKVVKKKIVKK
jgi:large subunit ribosomal protein L22